MDLTAQFKALAGGSSNSRPKRYTSLDDATILVVNIKKMKTHLTKYGHDYLNTYGWLPGASIMTDDRRDILDQDVEKFIESYNGKIEKLQKGIMENETTSYQVTEYRMAVIERMRRIMMDFVNHHTQLKTTKMKRALEKQKYERIQNASGRLSPSQEYDSMISDNINLDTLASITQEENVGTSMSSHNNNHSFSFDDCQQQSLIAAEHHTSISPDEIQVLAFENSQIHDELVTLDDEVKMIGKKVAQISKLQELFTENVMKQEVELSNLHETAIRSSENVREGNELIRDAMMKNASTRVFILFYILTLGFTILFLDWYNP